MTQPQVNNPPAQKPRAIAPNQTRQPFPPKQSLTEERIKEIVTETLIAFNLIPTVPKKKMIANV